MLAPLVNSYRKCRNKIFKLFQRNSSFNSSLKCYRHILYVNCVNNCDAQNMWLYQPLGMERHVSEWLAHLNSLTWDRVKQLASDYLQLAKTRWTVWDPRRGDYAFQVSCGSVTCLPKIVHVTCC